MDRRLDLGPIGLAPLEGMHGDGQLQVGTAWRPDGRIAVLLRAGDVVLELTPEGAEGLGRALVVEGQDAHRMVLQGRRPT